MAAGGIIRASDFDRPFVRLIQQVSQSIGTSDTALTFGTGSESNDAYNLHDEVTNNSRITVDRSGIWLFKGTVFIGSNTSLTTVTATIGINGGVIPARSRSKGVTVSPAPTMSVEVTEIVLIAAGDYAELFGTCGASATNTSVGGSFSSTFEALYMGPG